MKLPATTNDRLHKIFDATAIRASTNKLSTVLVGAFSLALIAKLARFGFVPTRFVICFGPMATLRAKMPNIAVASAAISIGHGVLCSWWKVLG